jgi:transcriptional regulator with XRE-family HTH domain
MNALAKALREHRKEKGLTQTDVAVFLNITLRQYMNYEKNHWPPHEQLLKLNKLFNHNFEKYIYDIRTTKRGNTDNG